MAATVVLGTFGRFNSIYLGTRARSANNDGCSEHVLWLPIILISAIQI